MAAARQRTRSALASLLAALLAACSEPPATERAADWLWSQQQPDGSWRSTQYAVLRSGQAMTPFVLRALLDAGASSDARIDRALDFIRQSIDDDGAIGYADPDLLEYPVYATAVAITVLVGAGQDEDTTRIAAMARWLARQQCGEDRGFGPDAPAYGAFGFGARGLAPGVPGHVDLAHTRHALAALAAAEQLDDRIGERALVLLGRLQQGDGGFFFSPVVAAANKAARDEHGNFRAYATATADGLLALRALGLPDDDARIRAAVRWLDRHASAGRIGGIPERPSEPWHEALRYYHAMVLAAAHPTSREALAAMLAPRQRVDGQFRSAIVTAMKEDDPLLATALALRALAAR